MLEKEIEDEPNAEEGSNVSNKCGEYLTIATSALIGK